MGREARALTTSSATEAGGHALDEKGLESHIGVPPALKAEGGQVTLVLSAPGCLPGKGRQNRAGGGGT